MNGTKQQARQSHGGRKCMVCSKGIPPSHVITFASLDDRQRACCVVFALDGKEERVSGDEDGIVCQQCVAEIDAFLRDFGRTASQGAAQRKTKGARIAMFAVPAAIVGGFAAVVAAPLVVAAVGFGAGGIAAGSVAAGMMSSAWTTGVGVGVVSVLQSVGAAGMGAAGVAATGATGAGVGATIGGLFARFTGRKNSKG